MPAGGGSRIRRYFTALFRERDIIRTRKNGQITKTLAGARARKRTRTPECTPKRLTRIFLITIIYNLYIVQYY